MTRERIAKLVAPSQRAPEVAPQARVPAPPVKPAHLSRTLEIKPASPAQLEIQRAQALETQRQADLEVQRAAIQRAYDDRFTQARAAQTVWHARGLKTIGVQRAVAEYARTARDASHARAAFVAQRQPTLLETLVAQRLKAETCPALPSVQRQADLTLSHVADHLGSQAAVQLARDPERLSSYAGFKNAGAGLVKNFRTPGSSHTIPQLAEAIQRFQDPMQRAAVEGAVYAAFGSHPTYPKQLQRSLEERDSQLEVQREAWQRELEPVAQRQALEEMSGENAAGMIEAARGSGQPLPAGVRALLEAKWNTDLSKVRVHTDSRSSQISKKLNAKALTTGQDIFFGASTFNPTSLEGLQLIAHEAWHTVQQAGGLVQAGIDRSASLEVEARNKGSELSSGDVQTASSGAAKLATRVTNLTKDNTLRGLTGHAPLTLKAVQRAPSSTVAAKPAPSTAKGTPINRTGGVIDSGGVNLRDAPNAQGRIVTHLKAGATLTVQEELDGGWYKVSSSAGSGYAASHLVTLAPDKGAVLHQISAGQPAIGIAEKYYSSAVKRGEDLRFYVNVLHHVNPDGIPNPSGDNWKAAVTLKNYWIWIPSVTFAQTLRGVVKTGTRAGDAYDAIKENAAAMVKATIGQLPGGKEVLQTLADIGSSGEKVLNNPGAFVANFGKAVGQGFGEFSANLPKHLEDSVVSLFTGTMGGIELPKNWDATGIMHVGLQMVGGTREQLEAQLVGAVPGGMTAINAAGEAKNALTGIQKDGFAPTAMKYYGDGAALKETILGGVKSYVLNTVVKQGIIALGSLFIPGAGIIAAAIKLYETIKFIWDKFQDLANTAKAITASLAAIASGNIADAVTKISASLVGALGLGVNFLARIAKLDGIVARVRALFDKIKAPIKAAIDKVIAWFKGLVKGRGAKPATSSNASTVPAKTSAAQSEVKEKYPVNLNGAPHTLFLEFGLKTNFVLDMQSKRDDLPKKIGRAIAALLQTKDDTPLRREMIARLQALGKEAKTVRSGAKLYADMDAEPETRRSAQRKTVKDAMAVLKSSVEKFGADYNANDIDDNVRQLFENPNLNTLAVLERWGWTPRSVLGRRVYQKNELILPTKVVNGLSNLQRMQGFYFDEPTGTIKQNNKGKSPLSSDDLPINLHHLTQDEPGDMVEMDETQHTKFTAFLHGLKRAGNSFRNTPALLKSYADFQSNYWKERARDFQR